jgi:hypothetical protein
LKDFVVGFEGFCYELWSVTLKGMMLCSIWLISLSQLLLKVISFTSYASSFADKLQML